MAIRPTIPRWHPLAEHRQRVDDVRRVALVIKQYLDEHQLADVQIPSYFTTHGQAIQPFLDDPIEACFGSPLHHLFYVTTDRRLQELLNALQNALHEARTSQNVLFQVRHWSTLPEFKDKSHEDIHAEMIPPPKKGHT